MSGRYARLTKDWMLRGWSDLPWTLVNWRNSQQRGLKSLGFYVAESCDGRTDFDSFAFLPQHHAMLQRLIAEGVAEECREGDCIEPWQQYRKADNPRLTGIHWCVTGLCNLHCRHCYMEAPSGRYGELPFDVMAGLVEQFERANVIEVALSGGEPFLREDLLDLIELLAQKKIRVAYIYTNGLLVTDEHLARIRRVGGRPVFQTSLDGVGAHDQMRGTLGTEAGVIEAIGRMRAAGFPVVVATCIDKLNAHTLPETYELMKGLEIQAWRVAVPQEMGNWRGTTTALSLEEQAEVCAPLLTSWTRDGQPFSLELCGLYNGVQSPKPEIAPRARSRGEETGAGRAAPRSRKKVGGLKGPAESGAARGYTPEDADCGACREHSSLLPDGTLFPCPGYVDSILQDQMPNLLREDLSKVWAHSLLRRIADRKKKDLLAGNPECAACALFKECGLGCRAAALMLTGNPMAKDPAMCDLFTKGYKQRFREMAAAAA
jgi:Fe-coproporphyrin III synthase